MQRLRGCDVLAPSASTIASHPGVLASCRVCSDCLATFGTKGIAELLSACEPEAEAVGPVPPEDYVYQTPAWVSRSAPTMLHTGLSVELSTPSVEGSPLASPGYSPASPLSQTGSRVSPESPTLSTDSANHDEMYCAHCEASYDSSGDPERWQHCDGCWNLVCNECGIEIESRVLSRVQCNSA